MSRQGMLGRGRPRSLLLALGFSIAAHGMGWLAWSRLHPSSSMDEWAATNQQRPPVVSVYLRATKTAWLPGTGEAMHALRRAPRDQIGAVRSADIAPNTTVFVPSSELDAPVVPMSAPDTSRLDGLSFSGQSIQLRLFIDTGGRVLDVQTLQSAPEDARAIAQIKAMLQDTTYIPGRLRGDKVPAQLDLELLLSSIE